MASVVDTSFPPEIEAERWKDLDYILKRSGPFAPADFQAGDETKQFLQDSCKVLIIGAGGLGCDLVKNLAMSGFRNIDIIDMDTISTSNLNRQFLFRDGDVGKMKAEVAARFVNERVPGVKVTAHICAIQEKSVDFYRSFGIIIAGLDSIPARRWINSTLLSLIQYVDDEKTEVDMSSMISLVDGGTEGFKGQSRVILPGVTSCYECTLDLFPTDETNYPMCTLKTTPRLPEHCIQYCYIEEWRNCKGKEGIPDDEQVDGDNPRHVQWIYEKSLERAKNFGIAGVTFRLTQGVIKGIIPAIASTNAIIASSCTNEAFKLATFCTPFLDDYMMFNGSEGIYTFTYKNERKPDCLQCGPAGVSKTITCSSDITLDEFRDILRTDKSIQFNNASLRNLTSDQTLYLTKPATLRQMTEPNLKKKVKELFHTGTELYATDTEVIADRGVNIIVQFND
ncbi:predicted protein [Naegleria gruberi]|uniref:NEDD8-activating enzyme E1 catalytic subunit n=1 Tax=Naegleria gruberi TaxID=5762 RepID=D2W0C4_NAEGR|nr:uncharacterized protein NAEGRDRAFT_82821 [Naegleria gruberi]EFC37449.1 predicted protein [Naegleria gruberi]|eukprot:XP_002670193.1 predicted protein [Naegleria gruberi strain NEG-M]